MRQRNDTPNELFAPGDPPLVIPAGATVDHPILLVGLTQLEDDEPKPKKGKPQSAPSDGEQTE